jgi:2-methylisocitrate lyase-like PEP mutase family enzyme
MRLPLMNWVRLPVAFRAAGFGGLIPELGQQKLAELGFGCVLYANASLQAALKASHEVLAALKREGSLAAVADQLAGFEVRQQAVEKPNTTNSSAAIVATGLSCRDHGHRRALQPLHSGKLP